MKTNQEIIDYCQAKINFFCRFHMKGLDGLCNSAKVNILHDIINFIKKGEHEQK